MLVGCGIQESGVGLLALVGVRFRVEGVKAPDEGLSCDLGQGQDTLQVGDSVSAAVLGWEFGQGLVPEFVGPGVVLEGGMNGCHALESGDVDSALDFFFVVVLQKCGRDIDVEVVFGKEAGG